MLNLFLRTEKLLRAKAGEFVGAELQIEKGRAIGGPMSARGLHRVNAKGPETLISEGKSYLMVGNQWGP